MSSLTERKKREIEMLYRKMKVPSRIFLNILFDPSKIMEIPHILEQFKSSIKKITGAEYFTYTEGTNVVTAMAYWTESEAVSKIVELMRIPGVVDVQTRVIDHGFAGPKIRP